MQKIKTKTLIIGAGPAGLAAAVELLKAGHEFVLVEADSQVGGLAKTYVFKEGDLIFKTDNGPHRFFSKNKYLYDFIEDLIQEKWILVSRQTRQFIDGKFYDYPINALQALRNIGFIKAIRIGFDYLIAKVIYGLFKKPVKNFADYVYKNFGKSLGEFNMINYTEKIWGIPANKIHVDWAGQRIRGLNIWSLIKDSTRRLLGKSSSNKPKTLVDTFYYPSEGTGLIYETILKQIKTAGQKVFLNSYPLKFKHEENVIKSVILHTPSGELEIEFDNLVESVPLTEVVELFSPRLSPQVYSSIKNLRHRSQVYLFITLDKDSITKDQWIYFPNKEIPFGRSSEMKNFSATMSPEGKTSIFVEFFCNENDEIWNMDKAKLSDLTISQFEKMKFFNIKEVRNTYLIKKKNVYPVYDLDYEKYLKIVKNELDKFKNLFYIGRPGRFRYNNQDHSLEMGILAAKSIINGKRYNIEDVGGEKEYYESGKLST